MDNSFWDGSKVLRRHCRSCKKITDWYMEVDGLYYCENSDDHPLPDYEKSEQTK